MKISSDIIRSVAQKKVGALFYTTTVDLKSNNKDVIEVQTLSFKMFNKSISLTAEELYRFL